MSSPATIAVLAGGRSRRMKGRTKALLPFGQKTVLDRVIDAAASLNLPLYLVVPHSEADTQDPELSSALIAHDLPLLCDPVPNAGPLAGLTAVLSETGGDVLLLACDQPFLTPDFLAHLVAIGAEQEGATVPADADGRLQPLCAYYRANCAELARQRLAAGELRLVDFVESLPALRRLSAREWAPFERPNGLLLSNVNTPDQYESALAALERDAG